MKNNLINDPLLGMHKDPADLPEKYQEEINTETLKLHDRKNFYNNINARTCMTEFIFDLKKIDVDTTSDEYWNDLMGRVSQTYGLNYLIPYMEIFHLAGNDDLQDVIEFLKFLKIDLISDVVDGIIRKDMDYESFIKYIDNRKNVPKIMKLCMQYIDRLNYNKFIKKITEEAYE